MVNSKEFSKRLQEILHYYGLSATAFSEAIDFNRSTISHLLSGRNRPSLEFVMKVLQNFPEVELHWLLNGSGTFPVVKNDPISSSADPLESPQRDPSLTESKKSIEEITNIAQNHYDLDDLEQVILFFKDGSFKVYKNHRK